MKNIFIAYSRSDKHYLDDLKAHLKPLERNGLANIWCDREIEIGTEWNNAIESSLSGSDIILLLISADFISSDYCYEKEMEKALAMHTAKEAVVVPILLRHCSWQSLPFAKLQVLPRNAHPVADRVWGSKDEPFTEIAEELLKIIRYDKQAQKRTAEGFDYVEVDRRTDNNLALELELSLEEVLLGGMRKYQYHRLNICSTCEGSGQQNQTNCRACAGRGRLEELHTKQVDLPPGVLEGMQLSLKDQGDITLEPSGSWFSKGQVKKGALLLMVKLKDHPLFELDGVNVKMPLNASAAELEEGYLKEFTYLDGALMKIKIPANTRRGKTFRIKGKGIPDLQEVNPNGDFLLLA